jgi:plasmid stabilization system protein ParE
MNVSFDPDARDELDRIYTWIAQDNPNAASELVARIEAKVMPLADPTLMHMGRPGLVEAHGNSWSGLILSSTMSTKHAVKSWSFRSYTVPGSARGTRAVDG